MITNWNIETKNGSMDQLIQLTMLTIEKHNEVCEHVPLARTALLTARGDHDLSVEALEKLGNACLEFARRIREGR